MFDKFRAWIRKAVTRGGVTSNSVRSVSNEVTQNVGSQMQEYNPGWKLPVNVPNLPPEQANSFLGPQNPVTPLAPRDIAGRAWDFPLGANRQITPRAYDPITFEELEAIAEHSEIVRLCIETRKDQLSRLEWKFIPRDDENLVEDPKFSSRIDDLNVFFRKPDGHNNWHTWLRMLIEQLLVLDAPTLFPKKTNGGDLLGFEVVDGKQIKIIIDEWGRTPEPPSPAYQQILKGLPAVNFTREELIYRPRNKRVNKLYGFSPVEQMIKMANIAIRRELWQMSYFSEGTDPQGFVDLPLEWTTDQIAQYQKYWDELMTDNFAARRKIKFLPGGSKYTPVKEAILTDLFDEWIARMTCFCFSLPPTAFTKQVNRATAQSQQEVAEEEGLHPLMLWVENLMDYILEQHFGYDDIVFRWNTDQPLAPEVKAATDKIYIDNGVKSIDEVRAEEGLEPIGMEKPIIITGNTVMLVEDIASGKYGPEAQAQQQADAAQQAHQNNMEALAAKPQPKGGKNDPNTK